MTLAFCALCSCTGKNNNGKGTTSSDFDVVYTKSDAVQRVSGEKTCTVYGVAGRNDDGTLNLFRYTVQSTDYGRTMTILSNSREELKSVKIDENTSFEFGKLLEQNVSDLKDLEFFMSEVGQMYKNKPVYFEMELDGSYVKSARFFEEYYR